MDGAHQKGTVNPAVNRHFLVSEYGDLFSSAQ